MFDHESPIPTKKADLNRTETIKDRNMQICMKGVKFIDFVFIYIGATKKGTRGVLGPPNKEQNWENRKQSGGKN